MDVERPWLRKYDAGVPYHLEYPPLRVFDFLDQAAVRFPDQICTDFEGKTITYREMSRLTDRLADGLVQLGLKMGERVGIMMPNLPQFVLAFYAVLKAGGIVVALNPHYRAREVQFHLQDAGVTMLLAMTHSEEIVKEVRESTALRMVIWSELEDADRMSAWLEDEEQYPRSDAECSLQEAVCMGKFTHASSLITRDSPAVFQYSGGTTGIPKAAIGLHRNLVANTVQFRHWLAGLRDGEETVLLAIPLYHVYGMVVGMSVGVMMAARLVLVADPRDLTGLLEKIHTRRASFFPGVPAMYAAINRHPDILAGRFDLRSIRACISGSAPLLEEVRIRFEELTGARLMEGYGLSEAPTATHCNPMLGEKRAGSIGLPLPDVDCRIVDLEDDRRDLPAGESGELLIRGPQVMWGYHNRPEETVNTLRDGWLYTGDIARMDSDGYFYILDRKKDLIKVSGFQVWPREVEEVVAQHPGVLEVAAAGIPHPLRGEAVKVWIVPRPGSELDPGEIISWCGRALVYYKVPVEVEFRESLPRTGVGKILRRELIWQHLQKNP
ncbi:MAG TPA: long-chain fatty acid--CoA ligase [Anaerolinea thermolimosa]|uniref:Long-chain fatty acid--CoA ligase n=1 Tax=Anaerolinea thermolimosa TaxID=229919 RepID=A0A3D1JI10_9CHLR|nr:long-chain fatty acid--CoA ligase [Anaerolinea thermolimosa]GAP07010.1 acyl-CoA synthetase [Anaerolinea thermolimosa]HCE18142.1 long-chain fatty acid--CoA ligase [Anaerolinea thermolimosa]